MGIAPAEARDLVEHFGSQRAAARAIGADESTVRYWLNPEPKRERVTERYHGLSGYAYSWHRLQNRRSKALSRRRQRNDRRALHG